MNERGEHAFSEKQVIDEYTLTDGNNITVFTHSLDGLSSRLKKLLPEIQKVCRGGRSYIEQAQESVLPNPDLK